MTYRDIFDDLARNLISRATTMRQRIENEDRPSSLTAGRIEADTKRLCAEVVYLKHQLTTALEALEVGDQATARARMKAGLR